ncbi:MAG: DUF1565 domain-containing protein [Leptolyngbya sp. SIO4C1]|nr:DUF1565 domain-containing protein [Leptolyngbya sp. SIO4C1]
MTSQSASQYQVLHVNSAAGSDVNSGTQHQPFKTITHALQIAQANTVIVLAPGRYSAETGESFPLLVRPGMTLQGSPGADKSAIIVGGGRFNSPTLSQQNVTLVAADRSGLAHVVVSNPNAQGHGVWVEAGQPVVREAAFVASQHTGLYVAGGSPVIEGSYFFENQVAGLVIYGSSQATVRGNHFEATGTAITVAADATPEIVGNRIIRNDEGLLLLGNARPRLSSNQIMQNRRNGVVEVATTAPVRLPQTAPQVVSSAAAPTPISPAAPVAAAPLPAEADVAASDVAASGVTASGVTASGVTASGVPDLPELAAAPVASSPEPTAELPEPASLPEPTAELPEPTAELPEPVSLPEPTAADLVPETAPNRLFEPPVSDRIAALSAEADDAIVEVPAEPAAPEPETPAEPATTAAAPEAPVSIAQLRNRLLDEDEVSEASLPEPAPNIPPAEADAIEIPVMPSNSERSSAAAPEQRPEQPGTEQHNRGLPSVPVTATSASAELPDLSNLPTLPTSADGRLMVPSASIPVGSGGSTMAFSTSTLPATGSPPGPPSRAAALGLRYRVFVAVESEAVREELRQLVPDTFRTQLDGRPMMQAGAYADEAEAQERLELLLDNGFDARLEYTP